MTTVQKAWEEMRMNYQKRYFDMYRKVKKDERNTDNHGALIEMSYVLINVFGLTDKQVEEIEKNGGFTNELFSEGFGTRDDETKKLARGYIENAKKELQDEE